MPKETKPIIKKIIFEAKYQPKLSFYNLLMTAAEELKGYPHWLTERLFVVLKNYDKRCSLAIKHNSFAFDQDSDNLSNEKEKLSEALEKLPKSLKLSAYTRLGYRRKYILPVNMAYESLISIMELKLFSQDKNLKMILPKEMTNSTYILNFVEESTHFNLTIGPISKPEIPNYIEFNKKHHLNPESADTDYLKVRESYPEVGVFFDLDIYQQDDNLDIQHALTFINEVRQKMNKIISNLCNYILSKKIEV
ncbi:MAG: hypothetical protein QQN62_06650 [Nitrosopumilus sp.]